MACNKLVFALLGLWSLSARAADPWCSPQGSRAFSFEWAPQDSAQPSLGSVHIKSTSTGKTIQVLDDVENYHANGDAFRYRDWNNDGCGDLLVVSSVAGIGNESNAIYLYNPKRRRFVLNKALSEIGGLDMDQRDKNCVTGFWKGGAANFYTSKHCWRNGKLVIRNEYTVGPLIDADGNLKCYRHVTTEYRGGKKKVKKSCTKEL